MYYLRDARLPRAVFLLFCALFFTLTFLWLAGQVLPVQAEGHGGQLGEMQPGPDEPDQPPGDQTSSPQIEDARVQKKTIYWGALISGSTYNRGNPPWDEGAIDQFEQNAGKPISILHWGQSWWRCGGSCGYQEFSAQQPQFDAMRRRGIIPLLDWSAWDSSASRVDQPRFALQKIIDGEHDAYIMRWAAAARKWGQPFFLRFNWEMNGDWFPWSERVNGNHSGQYVQAWRHVHDIFRAQGANNVTWVWCPNIVFSRAIPLDQLYPGDAYVDWTCLDGYNWGEGPPQNDRWHSFSEIFAEAYAQVLALAPGKPLMIGETASSELGGVKAEWIKNTFGSEIPKGFPRIEAVLWFNWNTEGMQWTIESSSAAQAAFAAAIAAPYYSADRYNTISAAPIPPHWGLTGGCEEGACVFLPQVRR